MLFCRESLGGWSVTWALALGLLSARSVILDKHFPFSGLQLPYLYNERDDVCWAERLAECYLVTSRCGIW